MAYTTPTTLASGDGITHTIWNASVKDNFIALAGAWTSYTPTLGGFTAGNGTATGYYMQVGKLVIFRAKFVFGSTSAAASAYPTLTLPVTAVSGDRFQLLSGGYYDSSPGNHYQAFVYAPASATLVRIGIPGSSGLATAPTTTTPFTWATSDEIQAAGVYEAA